MSINSIRLRIDHPVMPYVRRTQAGRFTDRAKEYHANQEALKTLLAQAMRDGNYALLPKGSIGVSIIVRVNRKALHKQDIDNLAKAVLDAATNRQGRGAPANPLVWDADDCWIDTLIITRAVGPEGFTLRAWTR